MFAIYLYFSPVKNSFVNLKSMIAQGGRPRNSQSEKFQCHGIICMRNLTVGLANR